MGNNSHILYGSLVTLRFLRVQYTYCSDYIVFSFITVFSLRLGVVVCVWSVLFVVMRPFLLYGDVDSVLYLFRLLVSLSYSATCPFLRFETSRFIVADRLIFVVSKCSWCLYFLYYESWVSSFFSAAVVVRRCV